MDSGFSIKENAIIEFTKEVNKSQQIPILINGQCCQINQESNYKVIIRALGEGECDGQSFDVMEIIILQNETPIDEICESMILDYMKKTSQTYIKCVDIEGFLIDYLKCTLIYENIAEPDDANKMAFKANGVKPLHIRDSSGKIKQVVYPANTIVLDKYFLAYERSAARRFTIGHECGHVVKERLYQTECCASYYRDASVASSIPSEEICEYFKMEETQASNFSAAFLMPHFLMVQTLKEFNGGKRLPVYGNQIFKSREKVILKKMADSLGVGFMAQFYRLKHFGMLSEHCIHSISVFVAIHLNRQKNVRKILQ